ncbi:MAG: hypothetical protein ACI814_003598, partial [Mariniblastus sp.]
ATKGEAAPTAVVAPTTTALAALTKSRRLKLRGRSVEIDFMIGILGSGQ